MIFSGFWSVHVCPSISIFFTEFFCLYSFVVSFPIGLHLEWPLAIEFSESFINTYQILIWNFLVSSFACLPLSKHCKGQVFIENTELCSKSDDLHKQCELQLCSPSFDGCVLVSSISFSDDSPKYVNLDRLSTAFPWCSKDSCCLAPSSISILFRVLILSPTCSPIFCKLSFFTLEHSAGVLARIIGRILVFQGLGQCPLEFLYFEFVTLLYCPVVWLSTCGPGIMKR